MTTKNSNDQHKLAVKKLELPEVIKKGGGATNPTSSVGGSDFVQTARADTINSNGEGE